MKTSVIIATYNGEKKIGNLLHALQDQSYKEFEIIIVIDGSTDDTQSIVATFKNYFPELRVIVQENMGRAAVRNTGARLARGELLIFFDDDMVPLKDCIARHIQHYETHQGTMATGGLQEEVKKDSPDFMKYKAYLSNKWNNELEKEGDGRLVRKSIFITAANFSVSKELFNRMNGFDERLRDAEDFDLAVRAYKENIPLYFMNEAFAWHNDNVTALGYIRRQRHYAQAHKLLVQLKPWIAEEGFIRPLQKPSGWRKMMFRVFCSSFWIKAIDTGKLRMLPVDVRYKVYDLVITANGVYFPEKVQV